MSLSGLRSSFSTSSSRWKVLRAVRNFIFSSHSSPVMAWKNQPSDFLAARISTTLRVFQSVSLKRSDCCSMRSITSARMRPSQRQGLPVRPTRSVGVPATAVRLPGHFRRAADLVDIMVAVARRLRRRRSRRSSAARTARPPAPAPALRRYGKPRGKAEGGKRKGHGRRRFKCSFRLPPSTFRLGASAEMPPGRQPGAFAFFFPLPPSALRLPRQCLPACPPPRRSRPRRPPRGRDRSPSRPS